MVRNRATTAISLPRKMAAGALRSALSAKLRDGELRVFQSFTLDDHKTKNFRAALDTLDCTKKVLVDRERSDRATWCWALAISKAYR